MSAQLLLLCVSSLTEWQTQDRLALKKILSVKIPKEKELAASPTPFLSPMPIQGIPPFLPLSDKFESKTQRGERLQKVLIFSCCLIGIRMSRTQTRVSPFTQLVIFVKQEAD